MRQNKLAARAPDTEKFSNLKPSAKPKSHRLIQVVDFLLVLCFGLFMCLYGLGDGSFGTGDQTTHSRVVQEMAKSGNYLHPWYDGRPYYNKPPFKMWLATIPVLLLGESNFSYRLVDGLSGLALFFVVFYFAKALFTSRLTAYFSVLALSGARVFFYGHGVRNAVQDGMMLLLMSIGTIAGWYFIQNTLSFTPNKRASWQLSILGAVAIGLAALTKNVAGYMSFIILVSYLLLSFNSWRLLKQAWPQVVCILAISLAFPLAYILLQGEQAGTAWRMLVESEVWKRATKGYHHVNQPWFYWNVIVEDRLAVPPELLLMSLGLGLWAWLKKQESKFLFLVCWAIVPVLLQSSLKSKLFWYILPAVPGMAILVGALLSRTLVYTFSEARASIAAFERPRVGVWVRGVFLVYSFIVLGLHIYNVSWTILFENRKNDPNQIVDDIKNLPGSKPKLIFYNAPKLVTHEIFYFNMLENINLSKNDFARLESELMQNAPSLVVTSIDEIERITKIKPFEAFSLLPPRQKRRSWLLILSYVPGLLPKHFHPAEKIYSLYKSPELINSGFSKVVKVGDYLAYPSQGPVSSLLLASKLPYRKFGTELEFNIASTLPAADGKLGLEVYLNDKLVGTLLQLEEGFHKRKIVVDAGLWRDNINILTFRYLLPDSEVVDNQRQLILLESVKVDTQPGAEDR